MLYEVITNDDDLGGKDEVGADRPFDLVLLESYNFV